MSRKAARPAAVRASEIERLLAAAYPDWRPELDFTDAYQLLVATILAAQSTDVGVNKVTPALFARFPNATALAQADPTELERLIHSTGFYRQKAASLLGTARALVERHAGEVPADMNALVELPGVGRKTANVVLGAALGVTHGFVVDTHVTRVSFRLGLTTRKDPVKIEQDLMRLFPRDSWTPTGHRMVLHGRRICTARRPECPACPLRDVCPRIGVAEV